MGEIIETGPDPINCYKAFYDAITAELKMPRSLEIEGKVYVQMVIDTLGQPRDYKIIRGLHSLLDKEALRIMEKLNYPFKPADQMGIPVRARIVIPISFKLDN